jgi:DNA-binding FadR family transcriptional regulator
LANSRAVQVHPIESRRLYRQIADQLGRLIASGEHPVGSRLPAERELAERLNVSRPSVREALIALEVEGIVEVRGGAGVFVREQPNGSVRGAPTVTSPPPGPFDVLHARRIVETEAASLAATHAAPEHLQRMKEALQQMQRAPTHSPSATQADQRFHLAIAEASGNAALALLVQQLWQLRTGLLYTQLESHFVGEDIWRQALEEHAALLDAVASRDPAAARKAMRLHIRNAELRFASGWKAGER